MYCIIQKIQNKKPNRYGIRKEIEVYSYSIDGRIKYSYKSSEDRFDRSIKDVYRISLRKSYREDGRVKQRQWVICTMGYYDILEYSVYDCAAHKIGRIVTEIGISEEELYDMIYEKLEPIEKQIQDEFDATEEGKAKKEQSKILKDYSETKYEFEDKYGQDTYDYCYDVFGVLRNKKHLEELKKSYSSYYKSSDSNYKSSYQEYDWSSYATNYQNNNNKSYTSEETRELKTIFKKLSVKLHPDNGGCEESMKLLNRLKDIIGQ